MKDLSRFLCITRCLPDVTIPVKAATRVKYQCIEVSSSYICLGASTGSTYVFDRSTGKLIKFISNKVSAINNMKFSHNEKILAVADSSGLVTCWEVDKLSYTFKIIKEIDELCGHLITALCWSDTNSRIFIGGNSGQVISCSMGFSKSGFSKSSVESIQNVGDSPIVQMDFCNKKLLISTKTKAILYNEDRSNFLQIGTKSRDGLYGSCFFSDNSKVVPVIYSARPGSRLWEVDFEGQVLATHQFKELLAIPPSPIIMSSEMLLPEGDSTWSSPQSFNFPLLYPLMSRYLLTWSPRGIYLFQPRVGNVTAWNDQIQDIIGISCTGYDIYFLHSDSTVTEISLLTTRECLSALTKMKEWKKSLIFACEEQEEILENVELFLAIDFHDILAKFKEIPMYEEELVHKTENLICSMEKKHGEVRAKVQEQLNQMWTLSDNPSVSENGSDDTDDIRSNISDAASGSILSEISLSSFWQKATNVVVSKVITTGFMKKSLRDALEEEGVFLDFERGVTPERRHSHDEQKEFHSAPSSPCPEYPCHELKHVFSTNSLDIEDAKILPLTEKYSATGKANSFPNLLQADDGKVTDSKDKCCNISTSRRRVRKKKKVKVRDIESPSTDEIDENALLKVIKQHASASNQDIDRKPAAVQEKITTFETPAQLHESSQFTIKQLHCEVTKVMTEPTAILPLKSNQNDTSESISDSVRLVESSENLEVPSSSSEFSLPLPSNASSLVNKLVNTTAATRNGIRDPGVLYNSNAIHDLLQRWGNQLAMVEKELREECFKQLPQLIQGNMTASFLSGFELECRKTLFTQLSSAFGEISNAAMLCFETNIYPKNCSLLRNYEIHLLNMDMTLDDIYQNFQEVWKTLEGLGDNNEIPVIKSGNCSDGFTEHTENLDSQIVEVNVCEPVPDNQVTLNTLPSRKSQFNLCSCDEMSANDSISVKGIGKCERKPSYDEASLSTLLSKSESDITSLDMIFDIETQELRENSFLCENFNILNGEECQLCFVDKCRACFVLRYFPVLNFTRMRSLLLWNGGCRWRTWLACMVHLRELHRNSKLCHLIESASMPLSSELDENDVEIFLADPSRLYNVSPTLVLDYIKIGHLTPWEITLLYQTDYLQNSCIDDFLEYSAEQLSSLNIYSLFTINAFHSALMFQPKKSDLFCTCGKARPGSNTLQWKWSDLLEKMIDMLKAYYTPNDKMMVLKFSQFCANNGYWSGYVNLLSLVNDVRTIIVLVYQLGDYNLLEELIDKGMFIPDDDLWTILFEKMCEDMESNDAHTCQPLDGWVHTLSLQELLELVAMYSGSKFTLAIINKFPNHNILSAEIYLSLVMAAELESKQEGLVSRLIDVASGNLWSEKKSFICPEFEIIKNADIKGIESTIVLPSTFQCSEYTKEESDAMWGRSINISSADCPVCTLPLYLKTMSSSTAGLIVFQCGHSFHKICLPENACLVCFHDNFSSLIN